MIPVQKYLLYAVPTLFKHYKHKTIKIRYRKFHNTAELCAAILDKGISVQLKRGLGRDYLSKSESLSTHREGLIFLNPLKLRLY